MARPKKKIAKTVASAKQKRRGRPLGGRQAKEPPKAVVGSLMPKNKKKGRPNLVDEHVGEKLRTLRALLGYSQESLADAIGLTSQQVQKYEYGTNRISAGRLFQFSKLLKVPINYFFDDVGDRVKYARKSAIAGFADNDQSPFLSEGDLMSKKETLDLVKIYYSVENAKLRRDMFKLLKSMADNMKSKK